MRYCHSFWTKPMLATFNFERFSVILLLQALSFHYVKSIGGSIVLHTDKLGKELFDCIPYDEVYTTLDDLECDEKFWAAGKIFAQEAEPLGSIHIDGDVLIKSTKLDDFFRNSKKDLVVQDIEPGKFPWTRKALDELKLHYTWQLDYTDSTSVCCGLVQFNNQQLKDLYISEYKRLYSEITSLTNYSAIKCSCFDLVCEQWNLYQCAIKLGCTIDEVLPDIDKIPEMAEDLGYAHFLGSPKYKMKAAISAKLFALNPQLHGKIINKIQQYGNNK